MNRLELVAEIAAAHELSNAEAARILATVTSSIVSAVARGDEVQIVGFGTFKKVNRKARSGFNPRAGEVIQLPEQNVPKFVPGAPFRNTVDPTRAARKTAGAAPEKKASGNKASGKVPATKAGAPKKASKKK